MINSTRFTERWKKTRARGMWSYAAIHALFAGGAVFAIKVAYDLLGRPSPENLTQMTILYFAIGGFAYGLIRFNMRERFYKAMVGQDTSEGETDDKP